MDQDQARSALAEVDRSRAEAVRIANRSIPAWFVVAAAAVLLASRLYSDLRPFFPDRNEWLPQWGLELLGLVVVVALGLIAARRAAVSAHRSTVAEQLSAVTGWLIAFYLVMLAIGMPMRYFRIPFDQTVSAAGAVAVLLVAWVILRRVRAGRA